MSSPEESQTPPSIEEMRRRHFLDPEYSPKSEMKHAIAGEVRKLIDSVAMIDAEGSSDEELQNLLDEVKRLNDACGRAPSLRKYGSLFAVPGHGGSLFERSPISGRANALAAPLYLERREDGTTVGHATYGAPYEGPPGSLHGGMVAAAFDEVLGVAQWASPQVGMTGTLSVKMLAPTPLGQKIDYVGEVEGTEGRKIFLRGKSFADGKQLAEAEGIFISFIGGHPPIGAH